MTTFDTFRFLSLKKWCRPTSDPAQLLEKGNWILTDAPGGYEPFGALNGGFPDDDVSRYGAAADTANEFGTITNAHRLKLGEVFIASLDDVVVQAQSLGGDRYHVFLEPGLVAAESYGTEETNQVVSQAIGETRMIPVGNGQIVCRLYDPRPVEGTINSPMVMASQMWMHNYAHWLTEVLPRLWYRQHAPLANLPLVLPEWVAGTFQRQTLDAVLPAGFRMGGMHGQTLRFKKLIFPSYLAPGGYSRRLVRWVNDSLRAGLGVTAGAGGRRLYISRDDAAVRRMGDEPAVMAALAPLGFERHVLSGKSVREQIELMTGAEAVVFLHGAGATNAMFVPPGAVVAEVVPRSSPHPMYWFISKMCGHTYGRLVTPDEGPAQTLRVPPDRLRELVEGLLETRARARAA